MALEQLRIHPHPYAFVQGLKSLDYSASIEEHQYWTLLEDHVASNHQYSMAKRDHQNPGQSQPSNPPDQPPQGHKRSRSPETSTAPSQRPRRSQRILSRSAQDIIQGEVHSGDGPHLPVLGSNHDAVAATEHASSAPSPVTQSALPEIPYAGTIIVSLDPRPPLEVRTGIAIPCFTVRVTITDLEVAHPLDSDFNMDIGALHAVVSLWSADGRVATPHAVPPMLTGRKDATLASVISTQLSERRAEATFSNLAITRPGHYRIRISIMETPIIDHDNDGDVSIGSPRQLLSIETRPIHAHGFAPLHR